MKIDEFSKENILKLRSFCIYGLGATGMSVVNYFNRENFKRYEVWDDNIPIKTIVVVSIALSQKRGFKKPMQKRQKPTNIVVPNFFPLEK